MKNNALAQMNRGMDVCPLAKDAAISALVMRSTPPPMEDKDPEFPFGVATTEDDNPSAFFRNLRAGRDMRGLI